MLEVKQEIEKRYIGVCDFINEHWKPGAYDRIKELNTELDAKISSAYDELNMVWKETENNRAHINQFILVLKKFTEVHVEALDYLAMFDWSNGKCK